MRRPLSGRRLLAASCLAGLAALLPAVGRGSAGGDALERRVAAVLRERHVGPRQVDPGAVARAVRAQLAEHPALASRLGALIDFEFSQAFYGFAPRGAVHDAAVLYRLPYDARIPRMCGLGVGGKPSHTGRHRYAFDFDMPRGTKVRAARGGVVARVVDGFSKGALDKSLLSKANVVAVLHSDGTFAEYVHLSPGIPVKEGQRVKTGDVLGLSGSNGYSSGPHLHMEVLRRRADGQVESVPIRFTGGPHGPFVPEALHYYGWVPRATVRMLVFARGTRVRGRTPIPLARGEVLPLRVVILGAGGARDVSSDPGLRLVAMTPWNVAVAGPGRIAGHPTSGFGDPSKSLKVGAFLVYYGLDGGPDLAIRRIQLDLSP